MDLGSNSFHLIIAQFVHGHLRIVDRLRDRVQIAAGLDSEGNLSEEAQERGLKCLRQFGEQLDHLPHDQVRAVGTNTFRKAKHSRELLRLAEEALGHPIEIISGQEEARLIYLGVCSELPFFASRRFVVDIGGGSTELILGMDSEVLRAESLSMGCVSFSKQFFPQGKITSNCFRKATLSARTHLQHLLENYTVHPDMQCLGSSGTVHAVEKVLRENGWIEGPITLDGIQKLEDTLVAIGHSDQLELKGLRPDRASVISGGLAILRAVFDSFGVVEMEPAPGALREGLVLDLVRRVQHVDVRERTVDRIARRFHLDSYQGRRVANTAQQFLESVAPTWKLEDENAGRLLEWAAYLHEIGLAVSHSGYHKHGEYLLRHSDLPGFSRDEQEVLAILVRAHRKRLSNEVLSAISDTRIKHALRLCLILRLSVLLHRTRGGRELPQVDISVGKRTIHLVFPNAWLDEHALTRADLQQEATVLASSSYELTFE